MDELAGYVAAEANHENVKKLKVRAARLYVRIAEALETDLPVEFCPNIRTAALNDGEG